MVDERGSPSAGWREVYHEMDADTGIEEMTHPCPDCGRACENVARDVYDCEKHGLFRASADGEASSGTTESEQSARDGSETSERDPPDADDPEETTNRTRWSAGPV